MSPKLLSRPQLRLLKQAIDNASEWRGQYLGSDCGEEGEREQIKVLAAFDKRISETYDALKIVTQQQSYLRQLQRKPRVEKA